MPKPLGAGMMCECHVPRPSLAPESLLGPSAIRNPKSEILWGNRPNMRGQALGSFTQFSRSERPSDAWKRVARSVP